MSGNLASTFSLDVSNFIASMQRAGEVTQTQADKMQRTLNALNKQIGDLEKSTKQTAANANSYQQIAAGAEQAAKGAEHLSLATAGARRELLVLTHEALTGNWSRFGGSLLVLAERTDAMSLAFSGTGAAIGSAALAVGGFFALLAEGAIDQQRLAESLKLTGNYAAMTAESFDAMSQALSKSAATTVGNASDALRAVTATGLFGPDQIRDVTQALLETQRVTGATTDEVVKDFAKMSDGVARWVEQHNRSMHFATAADYELIRDLEEQGRTLEATNLALDLYNKHLESSASEVGVLSNAWLHLRQGVSGFFHDIETMPATLSKSLDQAKEAIKQIVTLLAGAKAGALPPGLGTNTVAVDAAKNAAEAHARQQAEFERKQQAAMDASDIVRRFQEEASAVDKTTEAIKKYHAAVQAMRDANDPKAPTQVQEQQYVQQYMQQHRPPDVTRQYDTLEADIRRYEVQTNSLGKSVRAVGEVEAWAAEMRKRLREETQHLTAAQQADLAQQIASAAATREATLKTMHARAELVKQVDKDIEREQASRAAMADLAQSGNDTVERIRQQTEAIGKSADQLERLNVQRQLEAELKKKLAALPPGAQIWNSDPDHPGWVSAADELRKEHEKSLQNANDEITRRNAAQRAYNADPANGVASAFQKWEEDMRNQAKQTEDLTTGLLNQASDAFVKFAQTGKLNLGSLFTYWEEQVLRMEANKLMMSLFDSTSNSGIGTMLFDAISGGSFQHATGADYIPYNGYPAILHEGEAVLTKQQNLAFRSGGAGGSGGIHVGQGQVIQIGQGVSRGEVVAGINQANAQLLQQIRRLYRQDRLA